MRIAYFDCFSGISGDMVLGALLDAGCKLAQLESDLTRLPVRGWKISAEKVERGALAATQVKVEYLQHDHHRSLSTILQLIEKAELSPRIAARASNIFRRLGEAEARVHNVPLEQVHFHEVGAVDAIVDIVGAAAGFEQLGIDGFICSALNVGGGRVETQHGSLPVPAPATAELLRGAPTYSNGIQRELVTPTGAAIAATLATRFGAQPAMTVQAIGYGAGAANLAEQPNVVRLFIGEAGAKEASGPQDETIVVLEANLDDLSPRGLRLFCGTHAGGRSTRRFLYAGADEEESSRATGDRAVRAGERGPADGTDISRDDDARRETIQGAAAHPAT